MLLNFIQKWRDQSAAKNIFKIFLITFVFVGPSMLLEAVSPGNGWSEILAALGVGATFTFVLFANAMANNKRIRDKVLDRMYGEDDEFHP